MARKGNVHLKQEQWEDAIKWFDKSLTEHRDQEVVKRKQKVGLHPGLDRGGWVRYPCGAVGGGGCVSVLLLVSPGRESASGD